MPSFRFYSLSEVLNFGAKDSWICGFVDLWIRGFVDSWIRGFVGCLLVLVLVI